MPVDNNSCYSASPAIPKTLNEGQILFSSEDGGTTWNDLTNQLPADIQINSSYTKNGEMYLGTYDGKLYHSKNPSTGDWRLQELENQEVFHAVTQITEGKLGLYATVYHQGVYKHISGTHQWKNLNKNLPDKSVYSSAEAPDGSILVVGDLGVFRTTNEGFTWEHVYNDGWVNSIMVCSNNIICNNEFGLMYSTDYGKSWDISLSDQGGHYKTIVVDGYAVAIRIAGPSTGLSNNQWVQLSTNAGRTWQWMDPGKPQDTRITDIAKIGDQLFTSRKAGISRSIDMGKNWQLILAPNMLDGLIQFEMVVSNSTLFVIVKQGGC